MKDLAALALAVLTISWASILIRLSSAPPLVIAFYRLAIAAVVLLPFAASRLGSSRPGPSVRPEGIPSDHAGETRAIRRAVESPARTAVQLAVRAESSEVVQDDAANGDDVQARIDVDGLDHVEPQDLDLQRRAQGRMDEWMTLAAGVLLGLHFASWITSLHLTTVASSVVLVTTTPVFAALMSSRLLGERAGRFAWAGIGLSMAGSVLIGWGDYAATNVPQGAALAGDLLALAGAVFAAAYLTIGRRLRTRVPLVGYLVRVYGAGAVAVLLWVALRGDPLVGYSSRDYLLFAAIAIFPNLIGHSLLNWAVRRMRTYVVNVASLGEPVLATLYAAVIFGEIPGASWAFGSALIALGVLTVFLAERRPAQAR